MLNIDILLSTKAELQPTHGVWQAMIDRDNQWLNDQLAMMVQSWGMYADEYRRQHDCSISGSSGGYHWEEMGQRLLQLTQVSDVDTTVLSAVILRILEHEGCAIDILDTPDHE